MKILLCCLFGLLLCWQLKAQNIDQVKAQARAAGYSDEQINAALEKYGVSGNTPQDTASAKASKIYESISGKDAVFINTSIKEDKNLESKDAAKFEKFGYSILNSLPSTFEPNDLGPIPDDYVLGTGDELQISVWGQAEVYQVVKVDRNGQIQIPTVGLIAVSGLALKQAREVVKERMSGSYSGLKNAVSKFAMTVFNIRSMRIFIGGFVSKPGAYKVSGNTDVFTALYAAGGLLKNADFRNVNVIHQDGSVDSVDLYQNLLGIKNTARIVRIDNNDLVMVKGESFAVKIAGQVNRPGIYDLTGKDSFKNLIDFAGNLTPKAWIKNVEIHRIVSGKGRISISFDGEDLLSGFKKMDLMPGDSLYIPESTLQPFSTIEVEGAVRQPGFVTYHQGITVKEVIEKVGGVWDWTYMERAEIQTVEKDLSYKIESFHLGRAIAGQKNDNLILPDRSKIIVKSIWELEDRPTIQVIGFVHKPQTFNYSKGMTVASAIFLSGGFAEDAFEGKVSVSRITKTDSSKTDRDLAYITIIKTKGSLSFDNKDLSFELQPYDQVYVRKNPYFERQRNVIISGEVKFPGSYALQTRDEKIATLIKRAGGLKSSAFTSGVTIKRSFENVGLIPIDFETALLKENSPENLILMPGDSIIIPEVMHTVYVQGAVGVQTSILFQKGENYKYYIEQAGGFSELADEDRVRIVLPNGSIFIPDRYWFADPDILSGSTIVVPYKEKTEPTDWKAWTSFVLSTTTSALTILILIDRLKNP